MYKMNIKSPNNKAVFLDRDGVINKEIGYLNQIKDFEFIDGIFETSQYLVSLGYKLIVITNQSGIGRGYYSLKDYKKLTAWMIKEFSKKNVVITDVFHCPHKPEEKCLCRKPKPTMVNKACEKYNIETLDSWMIGDTEKDIETGLSSGIKNTILLRSGHPIDEKNSKASYILDSILNVQSIIKE